jgi:hypothetical protein
MNTPSAVPPGSATATTPGDGLTGADAGAGSGVGAGGVTAAIDDPADDAGADAGGSTCLGFDEQAATRIKESERHMRPPVRR